MTVLPEVLGAAAFVLEGMERCADPDREHTLGELIAELNDVEVRYALGMAIGLARSGHSFAAKAEGVELSQWVQMIRTTLVGM